MSREISDLVKAAKLALDVLQDNCGKVAPEGKIRPCGDDKERTIKSDFDFDCYRHGCLKAIRDLRSALRGFYDKKDMYRKVPSEEVNI
jgi:hypothetical protein